MKENIEVSIVCETYNHEKFVKDAMEGFLMQQTEFNYEILIHDDASTDGTQAILLEYATRYPDKIKLLFQHKNQYSKGVKVDHLNRDRAVGKYIAMCEGDDYWTDPNKLQKQYVFMEKNPDCSLHVHGTYRVDEEKVMLPVHVLPSRKDRYFSVKEVIEGGGALFSTNSMFYRREMEYERPDFLLDADVDDYPLTILLSLKGKVFYSCDIMSAYRTGVRGSWTETEYRDLKKREAHYMRIDRMLDQLNEYSHFQYDKSVKRTKIRNEFSLLEEKNQVEKMKKRGYWHLYIKYLIKQSKLAQRIKKEEHLLTDARLLLRKML
ncbi:glycosyltransferase family 2 protein [Jeotgalibacillus salarius]|uniref:Glycosyltransferase family 2 protein n=1 Tax=Jeotgalibacillus salarius TaxID=546023 RepID=A0A4Y8LFV3_9BACL|nr:glycosyltransferase family A protein [Jeotgalibacillus salarius]TFE01708.1 glycosyltransferase family 2 protein [Jeotgalibacillus salarius]